MLVSPLCLQSERTNGGDVSVECECVIKNLNVSYFGYVSFVFVGVFL